MINFDGQIDIAVGLSADSKTWKNKKWLWSDLIKKLSEEYKTGETLKEFIAANKEEQFRIKNIGGYVGGYLRNGKRSPKNVVHRQLITLDIDFAHKNFWDDFTLQYENAAIIHATHKHCETSPRYRLVMPLSRECSPDEYVAVSRQIAGVMGIDLFDNTTFETNRLMFWPSNPKDVDYYFEYQDGPWIDVDDILDSYIDWKDSSLWPTNSRSFQDIKSAAKKQEDPETKKGIIGAFCRTYTVTDVLEKFLKDSYSSTDQEDRYTYLLGSTSGGLIIYENKFAYSHHGTDPCSGKLCNAFDLVRIHLFGDLDDEKNTGSKPKSFAAMENLCVSDKEVKKIIAKENLAEARYDFSESIEEIEAAETEESIEWMKELAVDSKGNYLSNSVNINMIFRNDLRLKEVFRYNDFDRKMYVFGSLPWRKITRPEPIRNVDYSGVRNYIESIYDISAAMKIEDSLALEFEKNHYHPIINYLRSLTWDGEHRIDTLLIDLFGAEDNVYTREAIRKTLVGAVARVFEPGVKFDLVLTLVSTMQGTGKSSFLKALGKTWFSDTFTTVQGKEAYEQLHGAWLIEIAELAGLKKADIEAIKHFISKQEDSFRPAYGRTTEQFPRQCVFIATTNESTFLRDHSGNRRFMPVDIHNIKILDNEALLAFLEDIETINQIWAEAVHLYKQKEPLYLSHAAEAIASVEQKKHSETDERIGLIEDYLEKLLPKNWDSLEAFERLNYFGEEIKVKGTEERKYVCVAEIWCECLGKEKKDMDRYKTREINEIMKGLDNWEYVNSTRNFKLYGKQKYYQRKHRNTDVEK